jgi:hypothetical protein
MSTLDGLLLSDGCIQRAARSHRWHYEQTCREPTFLAWAAGHLPAGGAVRGPYGASGYFSIRSHVHDEYGEARQRWYPAGRKVIPPDFAPTPPAMLAAHLGDGSLRSGRSGRLARLAACAFPRADVERLADQLRDLGFDAAVQGMRRPYHEIVIRAASVPGYLAWLGACPLSAYAHKWALAEYAPDVCRRCGCDRDEFTRGCHACRSRRWNRRQPDRR